MSLGPAAAADCSSHWPFGCPGDWLWAWTHPHCLFSNPLAWLPSGAQPLPLSHTAPCLAPFRPWEPSSPNAVPIQPQCSPPLSPGLTTTCAALRSVGKCPPAPSLGTKISNPHPTSEIWSILFSPKHYGKGEYWNCWWCISRDSIFCSDIMLRFCVDGFIWLMTIWSTDKPFTLVSTFLVNTYLIH